MANERPDSFFDRVENKDDPPSIALKRPTLYNSDISGIMH